MLDLLDRQKSVVMRFFFCDFKIKVIDFRFKFGQPTFRCFGDDTLLDGFYHIVLRAQGFFPSLLQRL